MQASPNHPEFSLLMHTSRLNLWKGLAGKYEAAARSLCTRSRGSRFSSTRDRTRAGEEVDRPPNLCIGLLTIHSMYWDIEYVVA